MKILRPIFLFGAFALAYCVMHRYPPVGTGTVMLTLFILCLFSGIILFGANKDADVTAKYLLASLVPWLLAAFFVVNGAFDHSEEIQYQTVVVEKHYGRGLTRLIVRSWRSGRTNETLYIRGWGNLPGQRRPVYTGDPLTVGVKSGALGMPWISSISPTK
jgi:hypothetical protein